MKISFLRLRPIRATELAILLTFLGGCSGGGGGDKNVETEAARTLASINDPANPRPGATETLLVNRVVVSAVDTFDETRDGKSLGNIYVQDQGKPIPYAGITVFNPSFSPPDLKLLPGNVATLRGIYQEFPGPKNDFGGATLPEIEGNLSLLYEDTEPEPLKIQIADLVKSNYASGRRYLGMVVEVEAGLNFSNDNRYNHRPDPKVGGRWQVLMTSPGLAINGELPYLQNGLIEMKTLDEAKIKKTNKYRIRGVVQFFYNFSINPRSESDIELVCEDCINYP